MRLLIVEDEEDLADAIARGLRRQRFAVDVAYTMTEAEQKVMATAYDLVCLDWNLPDGEGIEMCSNLVSRSLPTLDGSRPKVLMLTARDEVVDRVAGLNAGADDYLIKPFAFAELTARVRALLRREDATTPVLAVEDVQLDPVKFTATRGGQDLELTVKEFSLLEFFMRHADEVLSQETLLEHVWDEMVDPFTNTVRVTVSNLRKKLGEPSLIETIPGRGYVLRRG